jgi:hypothetical protein
MRALNVGLAALCLLGLAYAASHVFLHAPLDPNEGWNAYHTAAAMSGAPLYPQGWFTNNYPPLSFYLVGLMPGDHIFAGRIVSLLSLLFVAWAIMDAARRMGASTQSALFAALWFVAGMLVFTDYVAMDDPQLLGHAIMMAGLLLLLRDRPVAAALAMAAALFVKHNLVALPIASALWLAWSNRRAAVAFAVTGGAAGLAGLLLFHAVYGRGLPDVLNSPRTYSFALLTSGVAHFMAWSFGGLFVATTSRDNLVRIYVVSASVFGALFSGGAGVDMNAWFEAAIAISLGVALGFERLGLDMLSWRLAAAALALLPLTLGLFFGDRWDPPVDATPDIAFLKSRDGPALCEELSLCYWAGKRAEVDVFNLGQRYATGAESDAALVRAIDTGYFAAAQMDSLDDLTPRVKQAFQRAYRVDHEDDNGTFLVRRSRP